MMFIRTQLFGKNHGLFRYLRRSRALIHLPEIHPHGAGSIGNLLQEYAMIRKLVCAMFVMLVGIGFVMAEEITATITKVDGDKITYQKMKKAKKGQPAEKDGDPVTISVAKDAKIVKGAFNKDTKKVEPGDAIEGGLKADLFSKIGEKGVNARITTDADNKKVTQIMVTGGKKKAAQ